MKQIIKEKDKVIFAKLILKITVIMIIVSVGLKLLGFNLFEADYSNKVLLFLTNIINKYEKYASRGILNIFLLLIQSFIFFRLSCRNTNKKVYYISAVLITILTIVSQLIMYDYLWIYNQQLASNVYFIFSFLLLIIFSVLIDIKIKIENTSHESFLIRKIKNIWFRVKRPFLILVLITIYQFVVLFLRNLTPAERYDALYNFLLNFDYIILLVVTYYIFLKKENNLTIKNNINFALIKFLNQRPTKEDLKYIVIEINKKRQQFKELDKTDKIVSVLYIIFFILEEILTLGILIFIANLNNYIIECVFILSAFLIAKQVFGAFHFNSFIVCFVVSNTTFFVLSSITMNVTSTFVVPIICGILLSYIASRFIKKSNITTYRSMPESDLSEICKEKGLDKLETSILIDFYCNRYSIDKISIKQNYSDRTIQRKKQKALEKLESR